MIGITKIFLLTFGVLTIAGGFYGYLKAGSLASVIAGVPLGVLLVVGGLVVTGRPTLGLVLGLVASLAIAGRFVPATFSKLSGTAEGGASIMATLPMSVFAVAGILLTVFGLFKR